MISLYSGTPGSGKSLHIAQRIYHGLRRGRPTICNFEVNLKSIKNNFKSLPFLYLDNTEMTANRLIEYSKNFWKGKSKIKEDSILLVIDECQLLFNSRDWQQKGRKEWLSFFSQHRKYGFEIVLVAQFDGMVDRQIRSLIEYNVIHRKASNFGIFGKIFTILSFGSLFCAVRIWYPLNERIDSDFFRGSKRYYNIYNSYDLFTDPAGLGGKGKTKDKAETPAELPLDDQKAG